MTLFAGAIVICCGVVGMLLTIVGLPGPWLPVVAALVIQWQSPETFNWWTIGAAVAVGVLAEIAEFIAGAVGAAKAGGTKRAAAGALVGGLVGAILGTPVFPIVGTVLGAIVGAGVGAALMDKTKIERNWSQALRVGQGAAIGRVVATAVKAAATLLISIILAVGAFRA